MSTSIPIAAMSETGPNAGYEPGLNRYSYLVAFFVLLTLLAGAVVTSLIRPISPVPGAQPPAWAIVFETWHRYLGLFTGLLIAGQALWLMKSKRHAGLSRFGWIAFAVLVVEAGLGTQAVIHSLSPLTDVLHALLGQVSFAAVAAIAVFTSQRWQKGPTFIEDTWRPSLRTMAFVLPAVVLLQIILGAAFRYHSASVLWHILNAMVVLLVVLIVCIFLVRQFPAHPSLRPAAIALAGVTSVQVFLGFATFLMLLLFPESSLQVIISSVIHVGNGALVLAASVALAMEIRRNAIDLRSQTGH